MIYYKGDQNMKLSMKKFLVLAGFVSIVGCSDSNLLNGEEKADKKQTSEKQPEPAEKQISLNSQGYHIQRNALTSTEVPKDVLSDSTLFHISLASNEQPILGASVEVLIEGEHRCEIGIVGEDKGDAPDCYYGLQQAQKLDSNQESNFFSILVKKAKVIYLKFYADGYHIKRLRIEGSQAKFLVMNIDLQKEQMVCHHQVGAYPTEGGTHVDAMHEESVIKLTDEAISSNWYIRGCAQPGEVEGTDPSYGGAVPIDANDPTEVSVDTGCKELNEPVCGELASECNVEGSQKISCASITGYKSFTNLCEMEKAGAKFVSEGECQK